MTADERPRKGRKTPRRSEARATQRERAQAMRSWLSDCLQAWRERKAAQPEEPVEPRHGVTRYMRNIQPPPPEVLYAHHHQNRQQRRHFPTPNGGVGYWPQELQAPARNVPAINPARDLKPNRRLRKD